MNVNQYSSATLLWPRGDRWDCKNQRWMVCYCRFLFEYLYFLLLKFIVIFHLL